MQERRSCLHEKLSPSYPSLTQHHSIVLSTTLAWLWWRRGGVSALSSSLAFRFVASQPRSSWLRQLIRSLQQSIIHYRPKVSSLGDQVRQCWKEKWVFFLFRRRGRCRRRGRSHTARRPDDVVYCACYRATIIASNENFVLAKWPP